MDVAADVVSPIFSRSETMGTGSNNRKDSCKGDEVGESFASGKAFLSRGEHDLCISRAVERMPLSARIVDVEVSESMSDHESRLDRRYGLYNIDERRDIWKAQVL